MKYIPTDKQSNANADPLRCITTCAVEVTLRRLVNDIRTLIKDAVLWEIMLIMQQGGVDAVTATSRKKALLRWFNSPNLLLLDADSHPALIKAVIKPVNRIMALKAAHSPLISLMMFVEDMITHCNATNLH